MTMTKRTLTGALVGAVLMAGAVGTAAQTLEETIEWLENKCRLEWVDELLEEMVSFECKLDKAGRMEIIWTYTPREMRRIQSFSILDMEVDIRKSDECGRSKDECLVVELSCIDSEKCVVASWQSSELDVRTFYDVMILITSPGSDITARAHESATRIIRALLHYQALVADKDALF